MKKEKKTVSIPIFTILIAIVVVIVSSVKLYSIFFNKEEKLEKVVASEESIVISSSNVQSSNSIINNSRNLDDTREKIENQEELKETEKKDNEEVETETTKKYSIKAKDGKTYDVIAILTIPSLNIEYPILSETTDALLKVSLTKYWGANPNQVGNMVVLGHNYKTEKFFSKLPKIKIGDIVKIKDLSGKTVDYSVYKTDIIDPYDNTCTSQQTNGKREITLITCYNDDANRFIAKARAVE